ncbi:protein FAM107B isoform X1 [Sebastes umbrosus]|uniref:protein FAM107B isoform X1 n=1 Tax=Sebastes umbrosus TaxID=72105 RepID=UPI00189CE900|nr:protein FAM107B isoform X1 [Sebastes umbrosus]
MQQRNRQRTDHVRRCDSFNNGLKQELYYWTETVDLHHPAMEASTPRKQQKPAYGHHKKETSVGRPRLPRQSTADSLSDEVAQPRKLNGSSVEPPSYQNLHRELLLSHKRGLLEEKPELTRVLEQRRLDLHKEEELAQRRPSDLEMELRKRQLKMQEYEQEEIRRQENEQKIPEFIRVKDNLRRTQTFEP